MSNNEWIWTVDKKIKIKIVKRFKPFIKCKISIDKNEKIPKMGEKLVFNDITTRVNSVTVRTKSHLTSNRKHITGQCILQVLK